MKHFNRLALNAASLASVLPVELLSRRQFVAWRVEERDGRPTKPPVNPNNGRLAESDQPATWATLEDALKYHEGHRDSRGVGFVVTAADPFTGVDLDWCRDPETGALDSWATEILEHFAHTYAEVSPSGTGLRIWARGSWDRDATGWNKTNVRDARPEAQIEVMASGKYFTVTGNVLEGHPRVIADCTEALAWLASLKPKPQRAAAPPPECSPHLADDELLERARRAVNGDHFAQLFNGDTNGHPSTSEADLDLMGRLAFWTGGDQAQMTRLFLASGLGKRDKAQRPDYLARTIAKALEGRTEFYEPPGPVPKIGNTAKQTENGPADSETAPRGAEPFGFIDLAALSRDGIPEPDWILEGWITRRDQIIFSAKSYSGKSHTCGAFAHGLASGADTILGIRNRAAHPLPVVWLDLEQGRDEAARMLLSITGSDPPASLHLISDEGISLMDEASLERLRATLRPLGPDCVIFVDPLGSFFNVSDFSDGAEAVDRFNRLRILQRQVGGAWIFTMSRRKGQGLAEVVDLDSLLGSVEYAHGAHAVWYGSKVDNALQVDQLKRRGGTRARLITTFTRHEDRCVTIAGRLHVGAIETENERCMRAVREALADGPRPRRELWAMVNAQGIPESTFDRALESALSVGWAIRPKRGVYQLATGTRQKLLAFPSTPLEEADPMRETDGEGNLGEA